MEISYKSKKENVILDILSWIRINILCPLSIHSIRAQIIKEYKNSSLGKFIKKMKKREESINRYTIENGLFYYRTNEFESWKLCLSNISYHNVMIHDNHDLAITGNSGYIKIYSRTARNYY